MFLRKIVLALVALIVFGMSWHLGHVLGFSVAGLGVLAIAGLLAFMLAIAFLLFSRHDLGRAPVPMDTSVLLFGVFVAVNFASIGWADRPDIALISSIKYFQLLIFVWLLAFLRSEKNAFPVLLHAYLLGLAVMAFGTLMDLGPMAAAAIEDRVDGGYDANTFAFQLTLGIPISIYLFRRSTITGYRWLYLSYVPLGLVLVVLAGSRTGILALGFVLAVLAWSVVTVETANAVRVSATRAVVSVAALGAAAILAGPLLASRFAWHLERFATLADPAASGFGNRIDMWYASIEVYLNNLLLGVGSGGGGTAILPYFEGDVYIFAFLDRGVSLHNVFLAVATSTGTVGLLLFLAMIGTLLLRALSFAREERLLFLSLIGASMIMALTLGLEQVQDFYFLLFLPVALSVARYPAKRPRVKSVDAARLGRLVSRQPDARPH
jgi:O-antigen ligase